MSCATQLLKHKGVDTIVYLIREELKLIRLFGALANAGFGDPSIEPSLEGLILQALGLTECSDDLFNRYFDIMKTHSAQADESDDSFTEQALLAYQSLQSIALPHKELL